jgi:hypothetical protein
VRVAVAVADNDYAVDNAQDNDSDGHYSGRRRRSQARPTRSARSASNS